LAESPNSPSQTKPAARLVSDLPYPKPDSAVNVLAP
jgi:hypothetical protein